MCDKHDTQYMCKAPEEQVWGTLPKDIFNSSEVFKRIVFYVSTHTSKTHRDTNTHTKSISFAIQVPSLQGVEQTG